MSQEGYGQDSASYHKRHSKYSKILCKWPFQCILASPLRDPLLQPLIEPVRARSTQSSTSVLLFKVADKSYMGGVPRFDSLWSHERGIAVLESAYRAVEIGRALSGNESFVGLLQGGVAGTKLCTHVRLGYGLLGIYWGKGLCEVSREKCWKLVHTSFLTIWCYLVLGCYAGTEGYCTWYQKT